jgi:hypothetical protein
MSGRTRTNAGNCETAKAGKRKSEKPSIHLTTDYWMTQMESERRKREMRKMKHKCSRPGDATPSSRWIGQAGFNHKGTEFTKMSPCSLCLRVFVVKASFLPL